MAERQAQNLPPQTGIIDFLRRIAAVDNTDFHDAFVADPERLMTTAGLSDAQKQAIRSADSAAITVAIAKEFRGGVSPDYIRTAHAVAPGLNYNFPDETTLPRGPVDLVSDLRRTVDRLTQQIELLSQHLE